MIWIQKTVIFTLINICKVSSGGSGGRCHSDSKILEYSSAHSMLPFSGSIRWSQFWCTRLYLFFLPETVWQDTIIKEERMDQLCYRIRRYSPVSHLTGKHESPARFWLLVFSYLLPIFSLTFICKSVQIALEFTFI